jgi:hypothetical protein
MYLGYSEDRKKLSSNDIKELSYLKDNSKIQIHITIPKFVAKIILI